MAPSSSKSKATPQSAARRAVTPAMPDLSKFKPAVVFNNIAR